MTAPVVAIFIAALLAPFLVELVRGRQRKTERREDWQRQDEVADRLLASNRSTDGVLHEIHTLVNSNLTTSIEGEMAALKGQLFLLRRYEPDSEALPAIETRVGELVAQLADRQAAQEALDARS